MLDSISEVIAETPLTRDAFDANKFVRSHVLRHVQIIGEAASRLSDALKAQHPQIPWRNIVGMGHVIVHDYFEIDCLKSIAPRRATSPRSNRKSRR